jgi:DNA-binding transcriptional MocR family regulator
MENSKYRAIFRELHEEILSNRYKVGGRLPSETELVRRFGASRMTVLKAIKELQALGRGPTSPIRLPRKAMSSACSFPRSARPRYSKQSARE